MLLSKAGSPVWNGSTFGFSTCFRLILSTVLSLMGQSVETQTSKLPTRNAHFPLQSIDVDRSLNLNLHALQTEQWPTLHLEERPPLDSKQNNQLINIKFMSAELISAGVNTSENHEIWRHPWGFEMILGGAEPSSNYSLPS